MELVDFLKDRLQLTPPDVDVLDQLNPFAVIFRYEFLDLEPVNRRQLGKTVDAIRHWAEHHID